MGAFFVLAAIDHLAKSRAGHLWEITESIFAQRSRPGIARRR
jgi:hypothetical protein